jgi:C1A family cysteine protease
MRRSFFTLLLAFTSLFLIGISSVSASESQATPGIVWQYYSLDDQESWHLDNAGVTFTETRTSLLTETGDLISQPALLNLHGRLPNEGLTIILDVNITVGAGWFLINNDGSVSMEIVDYAPYSDLRGSPGRMTLLISSTSLDVQDIQLSYHRPWKTDEKAERKLVISTLTLPQSIDLSHEVHVTSPQITEIEINPVTTDSNRSIQSQTDLPTDFDWRNVEGVNYVTPVKDQGFCGSCWAHAIIGATESALIIDGIGFDNSIDLSEQYLVSCNREVDMGCNGGNSSLNDYHKDKIGQIYNPPGTVLEEDMPYADDPISCGFDPLRHPYKIASYTYVGSGMTWSPYDSDPVIMRSNIELIKTAIYTNGPVGSSMSSPWNWCDHGCGVYHEDPAAIGSAGHDVLIVGWHDDGDLDYTDDGNYWIVKNSFGDEWNGNGYVNISFEGPAIGTGAFYVDFPAGYYGGLPLPEKTYIPLVKRLAQGSTGTWVTILDEDFEGSLSSNWQTQYEDEYSWGISDCQAYSGDQSLWWIGEGDAPLACGSYYPTENYSWISYGPIDLSNATSAYMKFKVWVNTNPKGIWWQVATDPFPYGWYVYDSVKYSASTGADLYPSFPGQLFGNSSGWHQMILDLSNVDGSGYEWQNLIEQYNQGSDVYIHFYGSSDQFDGSFYGDYVEGIFIDDVIIKKCVNGTCTLDW